MPTGWAPSATSGRAPATVAPPGKHRRRDRRAPTPWAMPTSDSQIQVSVSYTDGHGTAESLTSAATGPVANVNDAPTGAVGITGTATEDQTLTANTSGIADADGLGAFSYQWARSTDGGTTWSNIGGATARSYTLGDADVGSRYAASACRYTDGHGTAESLTSAASARWPTSTMRPPGRSRSPGTADRRPDPDREHEQHRRCRRAGRLQLPVGALHRRRHDLEQRQRGHGCDLRPGRRRRGQPDARQRELHRRPWHGREPDQRE